MDWEVEFTTQQCHLVGSIPFSSIPSSSLLPFFSSPPFFSHHCSSLLPGHGKPTPPLESHSSRFLLHTSHTPTCLRPRTLTCTQDGACTPARIPDFGMPKQQRLVIFCAPCTTAMIPKQANKGPTHHQHSHKAKKLPASIKKHLFCPCRPLTLVYFHFSTPTPMLFFHPFDIFSTSPEHHHPDCKQR